jgi:hypothetical protein
MSDASNSVAGHVHDRCCRLTLIVRITYDANNMAEEAL